MSAFPVARFKPKKKFALKLDLFLRKLRGEKHPAEELFIGALREATLFDDLLRKKTAQLLVALAPHTEEFHLLALREKRIRALAC